MPIQFAVDQDTQRVTVLATGDVRLEDMVALLNALATTGCFGFAQLFDARQASVLLSAEDIRRVVPLTARLRVEHGHARTAYIAESDLSFGMARMYATLAAETDGSFMVYRTLSEGHAWLGWTAAETHKQTS